MQKITHILILVSMLCLQITAVESVAEMKMVGSVDSTPTTTKSAVKLPPFKDNTFMVRACSHLDSNLSSHRVS